MVVLLVFFRFEGTITFDHALVDEQPVIRWVTRLLLCYSSVHYENRCTSLLHVMPDVSQLLIAQFAQFVFP